MAERVSVVDLTHRLRTERVPTGGVSVETAPSWIAAGALAVGLGAGLFSHSIQTIAEFVGAMREPASRASG